MRVPGLKKARLCGRWITSRFGDRAVILGYHRVSEDADDPYAISMNPEVFEQQLRTLRRLSDPISLQTLLQDLYRARIRKGAVAVTFDDGYSEVLHIVEPLLRHYEIPATIFVATGSLGREFWWDRVARIIKNAECPPPLESIFGAMGSDTRSLQSSGLVDVLRTWSAESGTPEIRVKIVRLVYEILLRLPSDERDGLVDGLAAACYAEDPEVSAPRALSQAELAELAGSPVIEIGSHSVSHPILSSISTDSQRKEIRRSKADLERWLNTRMTAFSYPNGSVSRQTEKIVEESGYTLALSSYPDVVRPGSNRFSLPRFWMGNVDDAEFSARLARWLS